VDRAVRLARADEHVVDQNLALLAPLGIPAPVRAPDARYLLAAARPLAQEFLSGLIPPFALFHPGSSRSDKSWGEDRFAAVAAGLRNETGIRPVISWGPGDEERALRLTELLPDAPRIPALDFAGLAHVMSRAVLFVAGDTGPLHLADALGTPTLALFSASARRNVPERNRPYGGAWLRYDRDTDPEMVVSRAIEAAARAPL
jgi:heptosyltransferase-1